MSSYIVMFHTLLLLFYLFYVYTFLLYCYYYSVVCVTVMPVSVYTALAFVFGFIQINWWWWWWWWCCGVVLHLVVQHVVRQSTRNRTKWIWSILSAWEEVADRTIDGWTEPALTSSCQHACEWTSVCHSHAVGDSPIYSPTVVYTAALVS